LDGPAGADEHAARGFGFDPDQVWGGEPGQPQEPAWLGIWPEHWDTVRLFEAMRAQWRTGPGGAVALDYGALRDVGWLLGIGPTAVRSAFDGLRLMEGEALDWLDEQRQRRDA
jgi:hypothetical protein